MDNSEIQVLESSFVKPMEPTTPMKKGLWLSSLDLEQANRGHIPTFYLYSSNDVSAAPDFFDVARLKEAMAKALVAFYPLAGRVIMDNADGRMEISCNDEGALFVVARSDLTIVDIKDNGARLSFTANVRGRVKPPLPSRYFGNALVRLGVTAAARDIASEALASVAGRIKGAISRMDDELVRSAVDYYETAWMDTDRDSRRRPPVTARGTLPQTHLHVISWLGMPMYDADFGWGKPRVMSKAESVRSGILSLSLINNGTADDGGVSMSMCMEAANMMELERLLYARIDRPSC